MRAESISRETDTRAARLGLCRGPGNLTKALGISLAQNRLALTVPPLSIEDWGVSPGRVTWGPRIGIRVGTDRPWRCWLAGHECVSGRRTNVEADLQVRLRRRT